MKETFLKIQYVVCWAGCTIPLAERTFLSWENAATLYNSNLEKLSIRVEEVVTKVQIKIVWPPNDKRVN